MYQREKKRKFKQSYRFWFECVECGKRWSTNKGMVIFYYALSNYHPLYVDIERIIFKQDCKMCDISGEIIRSSVKKIDPIKFAERLLFLVLELTERQPYIISEGFKKKKDGPPHDKERCDACKAGECDENSIIDLGNDSSSSSSSGGGGPGGGGPGGRGQGGGGLGSRGQGGGGQGSRGLGRQDQGGRV